MLSTMSAGGCLSIREKISIAQEIYAQWGETLRANERIAGLISLLEQKIALSRQAMFDCGLVEICRVCDEEEGGSCCGKGIEDKFCPTLLLINLLMGQSLPCKPLKDDGCFFLGPQGCSLQVRQVICVNYLCRTIQEKIPLDKLIHLQTVTGEELDTVFLLQEAIKRVVGAGSRSTSP